MSNFGDMTIHITFHNEINGNMNVIIKQDNKETKLVARSKNGSKPTFEKCSTSQPISLESALDIIGLEVVPLKELVPSSKKIKNGDDILGEICPICQVEYTHNEFKRELKCKHVFHKKCIDKWLKDNPNCPFCRSEISN